MVRLQHLLQQAQRSFLAFLGLLFAAVSLELHGELRVGFDVILTVTDGNVPARVCVIFTGIFPGLIVDLMFDYDSFAQY